MASATRTLARAALRNSARPALAAAPRVAFRQAGRRLYSTEPEAAKSSSSTWVWLAGAAVIGGGAFLYNQTKSGAAATPKVFTPKLEDYQAVYNEIASRLEEDDSYDDGSYGPVLVRLAWHASGTYDKVTKTGGSDGATMRFHPEANHGANAGLKAARDFLEPVKAKFPWITYSDLWILGGVCSIQEMLGPKIPFRAGRQDSDASACTPDGRLPDASQGAKHVNEVFSRMGFNEQETVALIGAHALGRCHADRSGYSGPWTFSPTVMTNDFFQLLLSEKWQVKKWNGPKQFEDKKTQSLMMLPGDMAFIQDKKYKEWVEKYAKDNNLFFKDFSVVIQKLFELGVPFKSETPEWTFKNTQE